VGIVLIEIIVRTEKNEDNEDNIDKDNMDEDLKSILKTVVGVVIGGTILYYLFYKPSTQSTETAGNRQRYTDLNTDSNTDLNNNRLSTIYRPIGTETEIKTLDTNQINNNVNNKIDVDQLTNMVQQRLQKRWIKLNKKENDMQRQQRYGFV
jgi:hypothetical protein